MLSDVVDHLRCPHCTAPLVLDRGVLRCTAGHAYDVARQGHVTLLPPRGPRHPGDTPEMVAAREAFLAAGHYRPIAEAVAEMAAATAARNGVVVDDAGPNRAGGGGIGCVVDVGAGTGWYLAAVLDALPGWVGVAIDASRPALRRAARVPRVGAVVADAWGPLPLRDGAADLVLSVFAPRDGDEIARILAPGGALIVVTPTTRHLAGLVDELGLLSVDAAKPERLAAKLARFEPVARRELEFGVDLAAAEVTALVGMGPSAHHVELGDVADARVTVSVTVQAFRASA